VSSSTSLLVTVTGWYRTKRPMHCFNFMICCTSLSEFSSLLIHPVVLSVVAETSSSEAGSWREMSLNLADLVCLPYYARFFNMT
jgi:hypothetical protein